MTLRNKLLNRIDNFDWDNPRSVLMLTIAAYFLYVLFRFALFSLFPESYNNGDEYSYKGMALSFFKTGDFYKMNFARKLHLPNYLYSLLLSPAMFFGDHFYIFMKLINSLLANLSIFPVFLISKEFMPLKKAFFVSVVALSIPFFSIGHILMAESLYVSVFLFTFYLFYKLWTRLQLKYALLSGISAGLLFISKPHALFFFIALVLCCAISLFVIKERGQRKKTAYLTAVAFGSAFVSIVVMNLLILGSLGLGFGHYSHVPKRAVKSVQKFSVFERLFDKKFLAMTISHVSVFFMVYLLPFFVSLFTLIKSIKEKEIKKRTFLLMLLGFSAVMAVVIFVKEFSFTRHALDYRLTARFYFMIFPLFVVSFAAFYNQIKWSKIQKIIITSAAGLTLFLNIFIFLRHLVYGKSWILLTAHMDAVWLYKTHMHWGTVGKAMFYLVQIAGLLLLVYYFKKKKKKLYPYLLFYLAVSIAGNYGAAEYMGYKDNISSGFKKNYLSFVQDKIPPHYRNAALITHKPLHSTGFFSFWLHYDYTLVRRIKKGTVLKKKMFPQHTRWVLLDGGYKLDFEPAEVFRKGKYSLVKIPRREYKTMNGTMAKGKLGYILTSQKGKAAITHRLTDQDYKSKAVIRFRMQTLKKEGTMNGSVLIGNFPTYHDKDFIVAGLSLGTKSAFIGSLGSTPRVIKRRAKAKFPVLKKLNIKVVLYLLDKRIVLFVNGKKTLETRYRGSLDQVNQVGFMAKDTSTTFSKLRISGS